MKLIKVCDEFGEIRKYIEIEITESTAVKNVSNFVMQLKNLKKAGFTVLLNDFGAGDSSLGMLKDFKVDILKLDESFIIKNKENRGEVVTARIVDMASGLGMKVIAEGIEFNSREEFIKFNKTENSQRPMLEKPMPLEEFEEKYL